MKRQLLSFIILSSAFIKADAVWIKTPVITGEQVNNGNVTITWSPAEAGEDVTYYEVLIYKLHKAKSPETLTLLDTDFDYIESTGTMQKHEYGKAFLYDEIKDAPGWFIKSPMYMGKAIGIDGFMNYPGFDNEDVFGGAYILSPQLDLSKVKDKSIRIQCDMAHEAQSVVGAVALYTYSFEEGFLPGYDIVNGETKYHEDLSGTQWKPIDETLYGDRWCENSRLSITTATGSYSSLWIDNLKVTVELDEGDQIPLAAEQHDVHDNTFTINTSDDTYAYQIRAVFIDPSDNSFRAYSQYTDMKLIGIGTGINNITHNANEANAKINGNTLTVTNAEQQDVTIFTTDGKTIHSGTGNVSLTVKANGIYIVKIGNKVIKLAQ